jgi:hypothetical protein
VPSESKKEDEDKQEDMVMNIQEENAIVENEEDGEDIKSLKIEQEKVRSRSSELKTKKRPLSTKYRSSIKS